MKKLTEKDAKIDRFAPFSWDTIISMLNKINEIIDWINARERGMKENADMLEEALERLEKAGWKTEKE